ncbi:MAG: NAD(+) diphosphatase [Geobacteraceae bacterium]
MTYPTAAMLPFNSSALDKDFTPAHPGASDPKDPGWWIIMQGDCLVLDARDGHPALLEGEIPAWTDNHGEALFIGFWQGKPVRTLEIGSEIMIPEHYLTEHLLLTFFQESLPDNLLSLLGRAQQILMWQRKSAVCPRCGGGTDLIPGTWGKGCRSCGYQHFPAIHPCTLVLVTRETEVLLVRKADWPPGYYSLPSGFCDFGESLEECARREVEEETGIRISSLRYVGSQCWPFPSQLMAGFTADFAEGEIVVDREELEDAAWFPRNALPPSFSPKSIAGWMIKTFA